MNKKNITIRLSERSRLAISRIASKKGISQGDFIESLIQKEEGTQDVFLVLEHCINTLLNAESEIENMYSGQEKPGEIKMLKSRFALCQNILIDCPEITEDPRSFTEVEGEQIMRLPSTGWRPVFNEIISNFK